jgi:PPM family protein phosphatase
MLKWRAAARTDAGCQRQRNEDNFYVSPDQRVFAVADGMGGAVGGAKASKLAVEAIEAQWVNNPPKMDDEEAIQTWLMDAVNHANDAVWHEAEEDATVRGMGTTVVVAVQSDQDFIQIAHVGDSRAYLLRDGKPMLLTNDHSVVQEMVRAGRLTEEQARINPYKNLITRCLGHEEKVEVDHTPVDVRPKDWIVLCSDGLPTVLRDEQICDVVSKKEEPDNVCDELVKQTLDGGAPDNVTVVAIQYMDSNSSSDNGSK